MSWDVSGYYLYLPAVFIYQDLDDLAFARPLLEKYAATSAYYQSVRVDNGHEVIKYPAGWALVNTPFFLLGHAYAKATDYPVDGLSPPYQAAIAFGSFLIALLGLFLTRKLLLRYFEDATVACTLVLLVLGTNYLNYVTADVAMTHNYLFTAYAALLLLTDNWHKDPRWKTALGIALVLGIMTLMRPTEFLAILLPILWPHSKGWHAKWKQLLQAKGQILLIAMIMFLIGMIQFSYWKYTTGHWLFYSYKEGFDFASPYLKKVLFSFRKGWFVYTPLMLFAVVGFYFLYRKHRNVFPALFVFFLLNLWVISAWQTWWYGGSFGQRALVQSYVILLFPLAAFAEWFLAKKTRLLGVSLPLLFCIVLNLFQTWQVHGHGLHSEYMTKAYYWRIFFNTQVTEWDKFRMDTKEDFLGPRFEVQRIYENDLESMEMQPGLDSTYTFGGSLALICSSEIEHSPKLIVNEEKIQAAEGDWIRVGGHFYSDQRIWDPWQMALLEICFNDDNRCSTYRIIRPQRILKAGVWKEVWIDTPIPEKPFNRLEIRILQPNGQSSLRADDLYVEIYKSNESK
ncbi:MAG: glycosyltransferase family 39 protein [Bacteroidetes bacterium]|nr:glycosyltransferase family 39 protein [Bacteroidota bacterium]